MVSIKKFRYPQTDVVLLCINLADKNTISNVSNGWLPEIKKYCNDKPIILGMCSINQTNVLVYLRNYLRMVLELLLLILQ